MGQVNGIANDDDDDDPVHQATAHYLDLALGKKEPCFQNHETSSSQHNNPLRTRENLQHVHAVAVWAMAAQVGSEEVPYHLDYAEKVQYQTNIIVPPLVAGTLHCTRAPIKGGAFQVSLEAPVVVGGDNDLISIKIDKATTLM
jgi:hypothetical protein